MRKMTKTAAVLAAMSAMTVASASIAFAATSQQKNVTANPMATEADSSAVGTWENTEDGWTFEIDGTQLEDTWAQIDGVWYYFHDDGIMASNELVIIDNETYFFYEDGRMHADGWLDFDSDSEEMLDYFEEADLLLDEYEDDIQNEVDNGGYDTIWMYFFADGKAANDEWVEDCGMHYYMDDVVMVCGDYDHDVNGTIYGFAADGHMYVSWEKAYDDKSLLAPTDSDTVWYYYGTDGKKYLGSKQHNAADDLGYAWYAIDGKWYIFADEVNSDYGTDLLENGGKSYGTLVTKAYFKNTNVGEGNNSYYMVDANGVMLTGKQNIGKKYPYVTGTWTNISKTKADTTIYLDKKTGAAKTGWVDGNYYFAGDEVALNTFDKFADGPTTYAPKYVEVYGHMVKNAFLTEKDSTDVKLINNKGKLVEGTVTLVGYVSANDTSDATKALIKNGNKAGFDGAGLIAWDKKTDAEGLYAAYIYHDNDGVVAPAGTFVTGRNKILGTRYTATDETININGQDLQVFIYYNEN